MNEQPTTLVTAVIPTRGRPSLVLRAIQSALDQSHRALEVVVVVDGPDPETVALLSCMDDARVRVLALEMSVGGSEARNLGVRAARGSWVAMLDDDDQWVPEKIAMQLAAAQSMTTPFRLVTSQRLERRSGHADVLAPRRGPKVDEDISEYMFVPEDEQHHLCGPQTSSFFANRELCLVLPFSPGLQCHQDWDWYLRAMHHEGVAATLLEVPLYIMDVEPGRSRMTQAQRTRLSLAWLASCRTLFSVRAYRSFLINECMFRLEALRGRTAIFRELIALCREDGPLSRSEWWTVSKWYVLRPSLRIALRSVQRRLRASLSRLRPGGPGKKPVSRGLLALSREVPE